MVKPLVLRKRYRQSQSEECQLALQTPPARCRQPQVKARATGLKEIRKTNLGNPRARHRQPPAKAQAPKLPTKIYNPRFKTQQWELSTSSELL